MLAVEEAARLLRIGRSLAYELARRYLSTGGLDGLPVIKVGSRLRVPQWALLELLHTGRVVNLNELPPIPATAPSRSAPSARTRRPRRDDVRALSSVRKSV